MGAVSTVLAIDDDRLVRIAFRRVLERSGYQVREASDGSMGLSEFRAHPRCCSICACRAPTASTC